MRRSLAVTVLLSATVSCGAPQESRDAREEAAPVEMSNAAADMSTEEATTARAPGAGPNIAPTAAPGVAFNYSYAFRLEADRIESVQERHAAMCEQLGPNRCRITGMLYRVRNERDIEARLNLKLEPSIARRFGREGVNVVTQADGMLVESEITGTDVGTSIRRAGRTIAQMEEDLRRIEARLAGRLSSSDRQNLEYQAEQLRISIRAAQENREEAQESLATTPMTFVYGSGDLVPGSDRRRPLGQSLRQAGENFLEAASVLLVILVTLLPWALLALLVWLIGRRVRRRWFGGDAPSPAAAAQPTES